jgi:hypothetical protein
MGAAEPADAEADAAWADVLARWDDDAAHRAFLERFRALEDLAEAGRRYRAVLDLRPGDAVALRWRDEVVKRATALALAQLPRTKPPRELPRGMRVAILVALASASVASAAWLLFRLAAGGPR